MEKKRNQVARSGQMNSDFKKSQDVSTKQFSRRRKETFQSEYNSNNNKQQTSGKNRNNNHFYYDKRPLSRKSVANALEQNGSSFNGSDEPSRLTELAELDSVYNHGSKKQNLNHLLNFHKYNKETAEARNSSAFSKHGYMQRPYSKRYIYNKEQYLQANCQFIVKKDVKFDYNRFKVSPDNLVEWDQVVKVLISSTEESQCPICLYPPRAPKMTKCGHVYCFSCILHYLSLSDKKWRKCPICYESVHLTDLKSATSKHDHKSYKIGDLISMELMTREKGTLFVNKAYDANQQSIVEFPNYSDVEKTFTYSKLIMANKYEILKIIQQERNELDFQLAVDGHDCPESVFVQQAIDLLKIKQNEIENLIEEEHLNADVSKSADSRDLAQSVNDENRSVVLENVENEASNALMDEDCILTVGDIDIVPVLSSIQSNHFYYYQAPNAQNIFLHSVNSRMLQQMYGSLEKSPQNIRGKIVQIDCCSMNEDLRKRLKYLQHLPVSSVFEIVEIEFEPDTISKDVFGLFRDELLHRRKTRQRREREEKKRERVINEINDRQMGKILKSASANIDIGSATQFPECGNFNDMPALASSASERSISPTLSCSPATSGLPSFATMLTSPTTNKSEKLWPSLGPSSLEQPSTSCSFFKDDKKITTEASYKGMAAHAQQILEENDQADDEMDACKAPIYKNNLSDALANAFKSASLNDSSVTKSSGKKKKKMLLFSSGMNFN